MKTGCGHPPDGAAKDRHFGLLYKCTNTMLKIEQMRSLRTCLILISLMLLSQSGGLNAQTKERCSPGFIWDGVKCVSCVRPCNTGLIGICGRGLMNCPTGELVCEVTVRPGDRVEICNGEDDDCDGQKDEGFDKDGDGYTTCGGDCNDRDPAIHADAVERCDGVDSDCNGVIDDPFDIGTLCSVGKGACMQKGRRKCSSDGASVICEAIAGKPVEEICDGIDNDCDGQVDNGLGETVCGVGACRVTVPACVDGRTNKCVPLKSSAEICGDDIDNDCDGRVDEDFENLRKSCRAGVGFCEMTGVYECSLDKLSLKCNAVPGEPRQEICGNRMDDDCNGVIDDAAGIGISCDNAQLGECRREGITVCDARKGAVVCSAGRIEPRSEKCDGLDNDCDGETDEGVKNACGGCGELPAKLGDRCQVPGTDVCGTGVWECGAQEPGKLVCSPRFALSEQRFCADDDNSCTRDVCHEGVCSHYPLADGTQCTDSNACTAPDVCVGGQCKATAQLACEDRNECSIDSCDPALGCRHEPIGGGVKNECGGCDPQLVKTGDACELAALAGVCAKGEYGCTPEGSVACVQTRFSSEEICNAQDDDCDGTVDDDLGVTTCGVGACQVMAANCRNGSAQTCEPLSPSQESCENMGADDDCNGVVDDVVNVGVGCPLTVGTCIVPGTLQCRGGRTPACTAVNPSDAGDDNGNGVPNYCEREGVAVSFNLYDPKRTRAAMVPLARVDASTVTSADPGSAWLVVSGSNADSSGIAAVPLREIFEDKRIFFRSCRMADDRRLEEMTVTPEGDLLALSGGGYLRVARISQLLSSAGGGACKLNADVVSSDDTRPWSMTQSQTSESCRVQRIASISSASKDAIAGAVMCSRRGMSGLGADIITISGATNEHLFIPLWESPKVIEDAALVPLTGEKGGFGVVAFVEGRTVLALCRSGGAGWGCVRTEAVDAAGPLMQLTRTKNDPSLFGAKDGRLFRFEAAGNEAVLKPRGSDRSALAIGTNLAPESVIDDVTAGGDLKFAEPHALVAFRGKGYGGEDLFAAYDILQGTARIGTMGFFFYNINEGPRGQVSEIRFQNGKGSARFAFTDPTGDKLTYRVHIAARHGGTLDHWIESFNESGVRFSTGGETAAAVGLWPIKLVVEVTDSGGASLSTVAVIGSDGSVESIQEFAK